MAHCRRAGGLGEECALSLSPEETDPLSPQTASRWLWGFLLLGVVARTVRYALCFPLWEDECLLSANLLDRGYAELTGPLEYCQASPLLFLWVQLTSVKLFGFNEYSLRLFSFVVGVASLFLYRHVAGRLLKGTPLVLAVAIFAVAYPGIRYSAEAKQYGGELFVSLVMMALALRWWQRPAENRWLWLLCAMTPLAVGIAYTAVFVGGGIGLFAAYVLWSTGTRRGWLPWVVFHVLLVGSFAALVALSARHQSAGALEYMQASWKRGFPPLGSPLGLLGWLIDTHTGDLLAYPFGGRNGGSTLTFLCCAAGVWVICRQRRGAILLWCLAPLIPTLTAAALHLYPYGQMTKFQLYLAPTFCLLAGLGAAALLGRIQGPRPARPVGVLVTLALLVGLGLGCMGRDFWFPAKSKSNMRARDFARWFWCTMEADGEVVCLRSDLGWGPSSSTFRWGLSAVYLCNQRIYSPRHARGEPPEWDRVSADHPLRCVEYRSTCEEYDEPAHAAWLAQMTSRYELVSRERYPFAHYDKRDKHLRLLEYLVVYKFLPSPACGRGVGGEGCPP